MWCRARASPRGGRRTAPAAQPGLAGTPPIRILRSSCVELVSLFDQERFARLGGIERGDRGARGAVELDHDVHRMAGGFRRVEHADEIDLALAERAVAGEVLTADEILK